MIDKDPTNSHPSAVAQKRRAMTAVVTTAALLSGAGVYAALHSSDPSNRTVTTARPSSSEAARRSSSPYVCAVAGGRIALKLDSDITLSELAASESAETLAKLDPKTFDAKTATQTPVGEACAHAFIDAISLDNGFTTSREQSSDPNLKLRAGQVVKIPNPADPNNTQYGLQQQ